MKTKFLGSVAVALGLGIAGSASAQYGGYPAAGYIPGTQARTVPVHPSMQQPPNQSQWPVNNPSAQEFAPKWSQGQPGFASQPNNRPSVPQNAQPQPYAQPSHAPQAQFAAQPRYLPQPYHTVSTGNQANGNGSGNNQPLPDPEQLPDSPPQPGPPQPNHGHPRSDGHHQYDQHHHSHSASPSDQPHHYHPSHGFRGGAGYSEPNSSSFGSVLRDAIRAPWQGSGPMQYGTAGACGPNGCGPVPTPVTYGPVPVRNWFAGANLLFLTTEQDCDERLVYDRGHKMPSLLSTGDVDPEANVGFDVFLGRYLHGGRHALMFNYFFFDPDRESASINEPTAGVGAMGNPYDYCAPIPSWNNISYDVGMDGDPMNDVTVYDRYDDSISYRVRRDVSFQGIEANLVSFGLGGAHRAGLGPMACGDGCSPLRGCAGPLIPGCNTKLQIRTTHGLRWFQFKDSFDFAASQTDYMYGKTNDDMYYNLDTENNLYGYQFGARLDYALGCKVNVHAGSKFGIYANDAEFRSRIGTADMPAYVNDEYPSIAGDRVMTKESDTVLSTLGELDLGIGYRLTPCWTLRGGYRLYGMTGIATTVGSISSDIAHLPSAGKVCADDHILLHGGYVGAEYNW